MGGGGGDYGDHSQHWLVQDTNGAVLDGHGGGQHQPPQGGDSWVQGVNSDERGNYLQVTLHDIEKYNYNYRGQQTLQQQDEHYTCDLR